MCRPHPIGSKLILRREEIGCDLTADVVRRFGEVRLRVTGTSMLPAVRPGDVLTVRRDQGFDARPGEIALFGRDGRLWAHRVVSVSRAAGGPIWITRGDALERDDPPVSLHEMLGRVVSIERGGERIEPRNRRTPYERLLSALLRRSRLALRIFLSERIRRGMGLRGGLRAKTA